MNSFFRPFFFRPGFERKRYYVFRKESRLDEERQPIETYDFENPVFSFLGTISKAKQTEKAAFMQLGHNVTHEVIAYHPVPVYPGDVITNDGKRLFYVHEIRNPGEIDMFYCIFTEEKPSTGEL